MNVGRGHQGAKSDGAFLSKSKRLQRLFLFRQMMLINAGQVAGCNTEYTS